ncbi:hypothetical protein J4437_07025 [Candidatus Woesearchaeota archaeon]|nr:hypothetical protein [Candidatus Woesearchaeota archaeon]
MGLEETVLDYVETEMSKKARDSFLKIVKGNSQAKHSYEVKVHKLDLNKRKRNTDAAGQLRYNIIDIEMGHQKDMHSGYTAEVVFFLKCIEYNLNEDEARKLIEAKYERNGAVKDIEYDILRKRYLTSCEKLGVRARDDFPPKVE